MSTQAMVEALLAAVGNPWVALFAKATAVLLVAFVLLAGSRRAPASWRHLTAAAAFGVLLVLPLAAALSPPRTIALRAPAAPLRSVAGTAAAPVATSARPRAGAVVSRRPSPAPRAVALGVYLAGVLAGLLSLLFGVLRPDRLRRLAEVSVAGTRLANERARAQGMEGGIEVRVSPALGGPVTFGVSQPVILLPSECDEWSAEELDRALRHELEHVARGDWATHVLARAALALYWPHPLAWWLWHRLRLEAERACDDAVVRSQGDAADRYAEQLVTLARRLGTRRVPALAMAAHSSLGQRVEAILDAGRRRAPRTRLVSAAALAVALAAVLAIAPVRVTRAAPARGDADRSDVLDQALLEASAEGDLARMRTLLDRGARADAAVPGDGSPLIAAAREGRLEAMRLLLDAGAQVDHGVEGDGSPVIAAAQHGHLEAVRLLSEHGALLDLGVPGDGNALIMAAGQGHVEIVRYLLDHGAAIEMVVPGDENALIHASETGQAAAVKLLLERGASVHARVWAEGGPGERGEWRTPLSMARRNGHDDVVRLLLAAGALR